MNRNIQLAIGLVVAFVMGGGAMWVFDRSGPRHGVMDDSVFDQVFDDHFFARSRSPFEDMARMRERMARALGRDSGGVFDRWFESEFGAFPVAGIKTREDNEHVYYVLDVDGQSVGSVDVTTSDGHVTISAELQGRDQDVTSKTSLKQRFPVPVGVEPGSVKVNQEDHELVIAFTKVRPLR